MDSDNNDTNELTDSIDNNRADNLEKNVEDPEIHAQLIIHYYQTMQF